jgi:dephospho-CoA kinase
MKKLKIAVTGNIGSGKSSFCKFLEVMKYNVIKADEIAKELMVNDAKIKKVVIKNFGNSVYNENEINKKYLAEKVFSSQSHLEKLNAIVHPAVIKKVKLLMNQQLKNSNIVFHEAALIYEADLEDLFDIVILITADSKLRMERKKIQNNFSEEEFSKRELSQIPEEEKKKRADFVFTNNGSLRELKVKAEFLIKIAVGMIQK